MTAQKPAMAAASRAQVRTELFDRTSVPSLNGRRAAHAGRTAQAQARPPQNATFKIENTVSAILKKFIVPKTAAGR